MFGGRRRLGRLLPFTEFSIHDGRGGYEFPKSTYRFTRAKNSSISVVFGNYRLKHVLISWRGLGLLCRLRCLF
jgi:hypothetical protein